MKAYTVAVTTQAIGNELVALENVVCACDWTEQSFNQVIQDRGLLYIVRDQQDQLIAYLLLQDQVDMYEIMQISVHPVYRQQGIASQLLTFAINDVGQTTSEGILLEVRESNLSAIALYQKLGFLIIGKRKNYYPIAQGGRENALLMKLESSQIQENNKL